RTITLSPRLIRDRQTIDQDIYIRNGDLDEAWRFTGDYPLAEPVPLSASDADRIAAMLADFHAAYNPDVDQFFYVHGRGDTGWWNRWDHWDALTGLDLAAYPALQAKYRQVAEHHRRLELDDDTGAAQFLSTAQPLTPEQRTPWQRETELWQP